MVIAPLTEEAGKGLFVLLLLYIRRHTLDGVIDGLVYAGLVGVGFAFTENILYYAAAFLGVPEKTLARWYYDHAQRQRDNPPATAAKPIKSLGIDELSLKKS